ncbi:MAG TPA: zf-HC2 domain-containing protein, partial [Candidatus Binatus sp.]|nr:zf-HC2 domain-containing protein [Candidatus Binatus sp.]
MKDADRNSEPLDGILRRAMREPPGAPTPDCADAESLAAYWDKSIAAPERERLEAHFADCARCQMQLAAIARAEESARLARTASKVPWYRRWSLTIPALAGVAAIVVFIAIRRPPIEQSKSAEVVAMAKREAPETDREMPEAALAPSAPVAAPAGAPASTPAWNQLAMNEARREAAPRAQAPRAKANSAATVRSRDRLVAAPAAPAQALANAPATPSGEAGRVVAIAPAEPGVELGSAPEAAPAAQPTTPESHEVAMNQPQPQAAQRAGGMDYSQ